VQWSGSEPTERILKHLAEIGGGRCTITEEAVVAESDPEMSQILLGLLVLHEDLHYASELHNQADARLRAVADERQRLLDDRNHAIEARDQFLAVAAHELRTPIATMKLLVDHWTAVLSAGPHRGGEPQSLPQVTLLKRQVDRLAALVAELLDVSRINSGGLQLVDRDVDLREIVRESLERFELEIQQRRLAVTLEAPAPVLGRWDAVRIDQVVTNLISNALKYGEGRPVEISVTSRPGQAVVVVRDHGVGIPTEQQSKVFGPFIRGTTAKYHPGLGLGLWIAEQIVRASGGRITVESRLEQGSTFRVELPA
jgi:signal transduction histidine kinase